MFQFPWRREINCHTAGASNPAVFFGPVPGPGPRARGKPRRAGGGGEGGSHGRCPGDGKLTVTPLGPQIRRFFLSRAGTGAAGARQAVRGVGGRVAATLVVVTRCWQGDGVSSVSSVMDSQGSSDWFASHRAWWYRDPHEFLRWAMCCKDRPQTNKHKILFI